MSVKKNHYVDNKQLEACWFDWIIANSTPELDAYRASGLLWTKAAGFVKDIKKRLRDPYCHHLMHCIAVGEGLFFESYGGSVKTRQTLPMELNIDHQVRLYGNPAPMHDLCDKLKKREYCLEVRTANSWDELSEHIYKMCHGIAMKFNMRSDEEREDLFHSAWEMVADKLARNKLRFAPGKAPAFNLLTTTIYRCMYSILGRSTKQARNAAKLIDGIVSGQINPDASQHSLKLYDDSLCCIKTR